MTRRATFLSYMQNQLFGIKLHIKEGVGLQHSVNVYIQCPLTVINILSFFMSRNPGVRTIEEELLNALFKAEVITEDDKACLGKVKV